MNREFTTHYSFKVASLVTGISVALSLIMDSGHLYPLLISQLPEELGITAVDRLYPLKPKKPV